MTLRRVIESVVVVLLAWLLTIYGHPWYGLLVSIVAFALIWL